MDKFASFSAADYWHTNSIFTLTHAPRLFCVLYRECYNQSGFDLFLVGWFHFPRAGET